MPVASTVTVDITAKTAKFENGLKKAKKQAGGFGKAIAGAMRIAGIATGAATLALIQLTKESLRVVDEQRKVARTIGTTQRVFAGLSLAAEISGVQVAAFTKALKRQQKSIVDANDGLMTQKRAFERLGLSTKELLKLPVEKQFKAITTALGTIENATIKVAVASDIFGAKNADLINVLELGEAGLDSFINKVDELGVALNEGQTKAIEDANDAIVIMKKSFVGLGNQIAARIAPSLKTAAEKIGEITAAVTRAIPKMLAWANSIFGVQRALDNFNSIADINAELMVLDSEINYSVGVLNESKKAWKEYLKENTKYPGQAKDANANLAIQERLLAELRKRYDELIAKRLQLRKAGQVDLVSGTGGGVEDDKFKIGKSESGRDIQALVRERIKADTARWDAWKNSAVSAIEATLTPSERLQETAFQINRELNKNPYFKPEQAGRLMAEAVDIYVEELERLKTENDDIFKHMTEFQASAFQNMQGILAEYLFDPFDKGLKNMLQGFVDMLRKMIAELLAAQILTSFFSMFLPATPISKISGVQSAGIGPPAAIGGNRAGRQPILVGERGPELFTPGATGAVRPVGSVMMESNTTIGGGGGLDIATLIPILEENNRKVKGEILDALDRGAYA